MLFKKIKLTAGKTRRFLFGEIFGLFIRLMSEGIILSGKGGR